ncbi:adenylate/guanylate cyclase domain-containing protein [Methylocapsa sp. S129]|uniref:adenylate/guanylate cyclase domain-containing protein n=1 Tax=Methylocapsa sp. S129 TaxID=1641869 RepID=UPI00131CD13C|nr:adenylate/guanylate cyclase domain-containing protein [Methylocapsa sp. S129]
MPSELLGQSAARPTIDPKNLVTVESFQRPATERPGSETIEGIAEWLIGGARRNPSFTQTFDELAWRLVATGMPLLRASLHSNTLHPQFLGATYVWWRDEAQTQKIMIKHEIADFIPYQENPIRRVREGGETLRRRMDGPEAPFDFPVLHDLKARGATEFFALPIASQFGFGVHVAIYVADRPSGFTEREIRDLSSLSERLSVIADMNSQRQIAENVLKTYLGPLTGPRVLAGQMRRGSGEAISAVLWSSDLRGFTQLSDRLPGERVIAMLNDIFDLQARAIADHGGEILKFIGDGLLAIFPVADPADAQRAAANALAAAQEAQTKLSALRTRQSEDGHPELEIVVALHYGMVIYGNVGSADRLDFTVIGPAVNLVTRIEAIAKSLDLPVVMSDDFAGAYGRRLTSLGLHNLRGLDQPHELYTAAI